MSSVPRTLVISCLKSSDSALAHKIADFDHLTVSLGQNLGVSGSGSHGAAVIEGSTRGGFVSQLAWVAVGRPRALPGCWPDTSVLGLSLGQQLASFRVCE